MSDVLETLRRHDPDPARSLTPAEADRAERLLRQIIASPPALAVTTLGSSRSGPRRVRTWVLVGAITATAAVGGVAMVNGGPLTDLVHVLGGSHTNPSLTSADIGSWTPTPSTVPSRVDVHGLALQCLERPSDTTTPAATRADTTITNVEQRGSVTSLIAASSTQGRRVWCLADASGVVTVELIDTTKNPLPAISADRVELETFQQHGDDDTGTMSAYGQAGSDVTALTVTVPGRPATATAVDDGIWSLWWPASRSGAAMDLRQVQLRWTTKDGARHAGNAQDLVWDADRKPAD
ncbi:hypothetical protein [Curtobacterium sp. VKM Ac-2922]|uniref:hypothetical protein n=1 Tax=Curtobacterium sp. VKM Ac-2922 TaxID=2929475 RepID=UPI001FB2384E|nr:hypothetical protein [Curtobacterium sp. VKM Ac-2922]MCJ1714980.1 hypothetical protein [Curtobacterium sp. VKM Ac-2922]